MATIAEVEKLALDLPETERAALAAHLLGSLPSVLHDEDQGIAEALRRDAEFEATIPWHDIGGARPADRKPSMLMRLVLHPKVYSDIDEIMGY